MIASEQQKNLGMRTRGLFLRLSLCALTAVAAGCSGRVTAPNSNSAGAPDSPGSQAFNISGSVVPVGSGNGTTITLSGSVAATTTASSTGVYSFAGLAAGTYAVTPSKTGFIFNPTTQAAVITGADIAGLNFTATAQTGPTFTVSGTVTPKASAVGVAMILTGPTGATATTDASGNYSFPGLPNGTYTVTPNKSGLLFTPASLSETVNGANKTGANFVSAAGSQQAHSVALSWTASTSTVRGYNVYRSTTSGSGYAKLNAALLSAVSFSDTTVLSGTTYFYVATAVDSGGDESLDSNQVTAAIP
jgi:hypothetical protein